jgi:starch phosphorylase
MAETLAIPDRIAGLAALARNLRWSWSRDARSLFRSIDDTLWRLTRHNPIALLRRVDPRRLVVCAAQPEFLRRYDILMEKMAREASDGNSWFARAYPELTGRTMAYFCAEFGLHNSVPIYSGGLGILAGDHCKAASDLGVPLVGIGLLYTHGYFDQRLRLDGWQEDVDEKFDRSLTPLEQVLGPDGSAALTFVRTAGRCVHVGAWRVMVGRVPIYLLDTDLPGNDPADRELCHRLYGGGEDLRLRQEWILGVGGVRVLRVLGHWPGVWHANEGHAAFMGLERLREFLRQGMSFEQAQHAVRATSLFTTHTPVPAGHDAFSRAQVESCIGSVWEEMGVNPETVLGLGFHPQQNHGRFHMAVLAIRLSSHVNGVSERHGEVSRRIWQVLWPGREPARVPIGQVTNGVHLPSWMSQPVLDALTTALGSRWSERATEQPGFWDGVLKVDEATLWAVHQQLKNGLLRVIREDARRRWARQWKEALHLVGAGTLLDGRALTIGFARRFATYKRGTLIFSDLERLQRLVVNPWRPVQLVFAGKAHPADEPGKQILQRVYALTREPRFEGRIAFVEDYEMHLAHHLVQGVDLWLNLPRAPLEASGTSGMKAALNGVPQLSTLDGWWAEGFDGTNGWAIPASAEGPDQDRADADQLYRILEEEVVPLFYERDERDIPLGWVEMMKHALRVGGDHFTAQRMVRQYVNEYYVPAVLAGVSGEESESCPDDPPTT